MSSTLRVLLIEASEDDAARLLGELSRAGYSLASARVDSGRALSAALEQGPWDCVLSDHTMPGFSGIEALDLVRRFDRDLPFIFVSGTPGEDAAVAAMRAGAHDYILKGNLKRLVPAVERELREARIRQTHRQGEARLIHLAYHDALTDLPNRVLLHDRLRQAISSARRGDEPLAVLILDLDGFKDINDALGHEVGDRVLREVAARLRTLVREVDTVARLGGDEFALVLPRTDGGQAMLAARKLLERLRQPLDTTGTSVSGSVGVSWMPVHGADGDVLLQKADAAMYAAKHGNLGLAVYSSERDSHIHLGLETLADLREGIARDQFTCEYQPIVDLRTHEMVGVEALARWRHPRRGLLPPDEFIPVAERAGLIEPLTMLIVNRALTDWARPGAPPVAVNLSRRCFHDPRLPEHIANVLCFHGVPGSALALEVTESVVMSEPSRSAECLTRLRRLGVSIALDHFGKGYSSLGCFREISVDQMKVDRSFVARLTGRDEAIVASAIELAHALGVQVVAEGVESAGVMDRLHRLGCDAAQGTFIAPPCSAREARAWDRLHRPAASY